jgi:multiple sugar transport system substrate-binding protein
MYHRTKFFGVAASLAATAVLAAGCTNGGGGGASPTGPVSAIATTATNHAPTTITVWTFNTLTNEVNAFKSTLNALHQKYPWLTVKFVPGKDDSAYAKAVAAGNPPDVFISTAPDYVGQFCHNGTVLDMNPYLKAAGIDAAKTFPAAALVYTQFQGKQCALPLLTDAYGIYYNKAMFQAAGIASPPKTFSQLLADSKKLTIKNPDGTIKRFGFVMRSDFSSNANMFQGVQTDSKYYNSSGKATFGTDKNWQSILQLDKQLIDYYGAGNVQKFVATYQPHTDDAKNPFVTGVAAMAYDGEWHIGELKSEKPSLDYGVAPFPVADGQQSRYGVGNTQGTVLYISAHTKHPQEAFFAAQQLATDTTFLNQLADAVSNIPSTFDSLASWDQANDPHWKEFISIFKNPGSYYKELTAAGAEDATAWGQWVQKFENGKVSNLQAGLNSVAKQVDAINAQAG